MEKALKVINELQEKGLIKNYAIGGGTAAIRLIEIVEKFNLKDQYKNFLRLYHEG